VTLKHHPVVLTLIFEAAGPGDDIEQVIAGWLRRNSAGWRKRVVHFADHGNKRHILGHQRHDRLGFNRPVLNAVDDFRLDLARRSTGGPDGSTVSLATQL
jgi:hypothetical protein